MLEKIVANIEQGAFALASDPTEFPLLEVVAADPIIISVRYGQDLDEALVLAKAEELGLLYQRRVLYYVVGAYHACMDRYLYPVNFYDLA